MENVTITLETTNAAFEDGAGVEVARILRKLADDFEEGTPPLRLRDINGNRVGLVCIDSEE